MSNSNHPECCPKGSEPNREAESLGGSKDTNGYITKIGEMCTYVTYPAAEKSITGVIVVFHDIFGFGCGRLHNLCDELANEGYLVVSPDWFGQKYFQKSGAMSLLGNGMKLAKKLMFKWKSVEPKLTEVKNFILENRFSEPAHIANLDLAALPKGTLGFCWGGWAGFHATFNDCNGKDGDKFFSAFATMHPAPTLFFNDTMSFKECLEGIKIPVLLMPTPQEPKSVMKGGDAEKILDDVQIEEFMDVKHGFGPRGDLKDPKVKAAYEKAMNLMFEFFKNKL
eukprot:maker-scaffold_2-snap-gene-14.33-mRNA-1 protein AED:0.00 eAED:0.00 QI:112/1/1/1/1/1/2/97/280